MFCPQCGKENRNEGKFCMNCGTALRSATAAAAPAVPVYEMPKEPIEIDPAYPEYGHEIPRKKIAWIAGISGAGVVVLILIIALCVGLFGGSYGFSDYHDIPQAYLDAVMVKDFDALMKMFPESMTEGIERKFEELVEAGEISRERLEDEIDELKGRIVRKKVPEEAAVELLREEDLISEDFWSYAQNVEENLYDICGERMNVTEAKILYTRVEGVMDGEYVGDDVKMYVYRIDGIWYFDYFKSMNVSMDYSSLW